MKKIICLFTLVVLLAGCAKDDKSQPAADVEIDKMQWLRLVPQATVGAEAVCSWSIGGKEISAEKELLHVFADAGAYSVVFKAKNGADEITETFVVSVREKNYRNGIVRVFEYLPAPGQFINTLPAATAADTPETMRGKAEAALTSGSMICLGGFGGYVVFGFDHTVINRNGNDFVVLGNAISTWAEPGVVMVARDANGNGLPDDEWYEIAGSEYHKPTTVKGYEITYYRPESEPAAANEPNYIRWSDNQGQSGYLSKNSSHAQPYYPLWKAASYKLKGTLMTANVHDQSGVGTYWVNSASDWGYADNWANADVKAQINIDWAVDVNGNPVSLKGIDFVKVYTGNRDEGGTMGEISTEVSGFTDLNL